MAVIKPSTPITFVYMPYLRTMNNVLKLDQFHCDLVRVYIYIHFLYYYVSGIRYDFLSACEALLKEWLNLSHEATEVF